MVRIGILFLCFFILTGCVNREPYKLNERYADARRNLSLLFREYPRQKTIDFYLALAYGFKYNLDYRIKLADIALQTGQLELAEFAMYPAMNVSGTLYTRSNDLATLNTTAGGGSADSFSTTPRTLRSYRTAMSWNLLDLGMSYVRAKQQNQRVAISKEQSRKQLQQLTQDVLAAYWEAYSAQELIKNTKFFKNELTKAKNNLSHALLDKSIPHDNLLQYEDAVLQGERQLIQLQNKYDQAMINLKRLTNLPLDRDYTLLPPPSYLVGTNDLSNLNFRKLDAISLVSRPELIAQHFQKKIADFGVEAAIFQALPGITLNYGDNYNSNKFLLNNGWVDKSVDIAWNLINIASLPTAIKTAKEQILYENLKMMALTLTVLTETRFAYSRYQNLFNEYEIIKKQDQNAHSMFQLTENRRKASIASDQQVILAKIRWITVKMDENLILADMSTALGLLYLSAGFDMLPLDGNNLPTDKAIDYIKSHFESKVKMGFTEYVDQTYEKLFSTSSKA